MRLAIIALLSLAACHAEEDESDVCGNGQMFDGSFEQCDDGNTISDDGCSAQCTIEVPMWVAWEFYPTLTSTPQLCRDGFPEVEIVTRDRIDRFPCTATFTRFFNLPSPVLGQIRDTDGTVIASTIPNTASTMTKLRFYETAGYVHASWQFSTCHAFMIEFKKVGGTVAETRLRGCPDATGETFSKPLEAGTYDVTLTTATATQTQTVNVGPNNAIADAAFVIP